MKQVDFFTRVNVLITQLVHLCQMVSEGGALPAGFLLFLQRTRTEEPNSDITGNRFIVTTLLEVTREHNWLSSPPLIIFIWIRLLDRDSAG